MESTKTSKLGQEFRQTFRDEIYNYRPPWVTEWGLTILFGIIVLLIGLMGWIKYPDMIVGHAEITTVNPPINLVSSASGKLKELLVREGDTVYKDQMLMILESSVNWDELTVFDKNVEVISKVKKNDQRNHWPHPDRFSNELKLGELQVHYTNVKTDYTNLYEHIHFNNNALNIEAEQTRLEMNKFYIRQLNKKRDLLLSQLHIGRKDLERDQSLYNQKLISKKALEVSKLKNDIVFQKALIDLDLEITLSESKQTEILQSIKKLMHDDKVLKGKFETALARSIQLAKSSAKDWRLQKFITAPIEGTVSLNRIWSTNQYINEGEVVISVIPTDTSIVKARIQFPVQKAGKVDLGQRVNIKLAGYPYQEYGMLIGKMGKIAQVPNRNVRDEIVYTGDVVLVNGPVTSYGVELPKIQQMVGTAEILTDELSLLMRLIHPLRAMYDKQKTFDMPREHTYD